MIKTVSRFINIFLILCLCVDPHLAAARPPHGISPLNPHVFTDQAVNVPSGWILNDLLNYANHIKALAAHPNQNYFSKSEILGADDAVPLHGVAAIAALALAAMTYYLFNPATVFASSSVSAQLSALLPPMSPMVMALIGLVLFTLLVFAYPPLFHNLLDSAARWGKILGKRKTSEAETLSFWQFSRMMAYLPKKPYFAFVGGGIGMVAYSLGGHSGYPRLQALLFPIASGLLLTEASLSFDRILWLKEFAGRSLFGVWLDKILRRVPADREKITRQLNRFIRDRGQVAKNRELSNAVDQLMGSLDGKVFFAVGSYPARKLEWVKVSNFLLLTIMMVFFVFLMVPAELHYTSDYLLLKTSITIAGTVVAGRWTLRLQHVLQRRTQVIRLAVILLIVGGLAGTWLWPEFDSWVTPYFNRSALVSPILFQASA